jgi:hypothetical protein
MKETLDLSAFGSICPQKVSSFVRIVCALNLQTSISAILEKSWAFSIALDGGNKSDTSYLDIRIRNVSSCGVLSNLHLLAIQMRDRHTGEHMYNLALTALDNLAPDWRNRIISVTTDGASSTTGHYCGVASRFGNAALSGLYRVWCALHQHDLVLRQLYYSLCDDSFVGTVTLMTGHLQRQPDCRDGIKVSTMCQHSSKSSNGLLQTKWLLLHIQHQREWSLVQWLQVLILCGEDVGSNPAGKLFTPQKLSIHIPNPSLPPSLRRRQGRVPSEILQTFS